jgi:uncharacterized protein
MAASIISSSTIPSLAGAAHMTGEGRPTGGRPMTPQEQELIYGLFERLSQLEVQPRDSEAERLIAQGLSRAPHAIYALVQTVLVQDEALKLANARIEQLQAAAGSAQASRAPGGFLDNMRDALFGHPEEHRPSAVPPVGAPQRSGYAPPPPPPPPAYGPQGGAMPQGYPPPSGGPSFLGTAAAAAAGTIGGSLLLGGIRNMLGGAGHGAFAGTFDGLSGAQPVEVINEYRPAEDSPWAGGPDDLSGQAGANDIDRDAGYDTADADDADGDYDAGFDDDSGGGSDYA